MKQYSKIAAFFWTIGNLCNLWYGIHSLKRIVKEKNYILGIIEKEPKKKDDFKDQLKKLNTQKSAMIRTILKGMGDLVTSSTGAGLS